MLEDSVATPYQASRKLGLDSFGKGVHRELYSEQRDRKVNALVDARYHAADYLQTFKRSVFIKCLPQLNAMDSKLKQQFLLFNSLYFINVSFHISPVFNFCLRFSVF